MANSLNKLSWSPGFMYPKHQTGKETNKDFVKQNKTSQATSTAAGNKKSQTRIKSRK